MISIIKKFKKDPLIYIAIAVVVIYTYMKFFRTEGMNTNKLYSLDEFNTSMTEEEFEKKGNQRIEELGEYAEEKEREIRRKKGEVADANDTVAYYRKKFNHSKGRDRDQAKDAREKAKSKKLQLEREVEELEIEGEEFIKMEKAVKDHLLSVETSLRERGPVPLTVSPLKSLDSLPVKTGIKGRVSIVDPLTVSSLKSLDSLSVKPSSFGFTMEGKNATCTWDGGAATPATIPRPPTPAGAAPSAGPIIKVSQPAYALENIN